MSRELTGIRLAYLYIEEFRAWREKSLCLTPDYIVEGADTKDKPLFFNKNEEKNPDIFAGNIKDIQLVVGQNGSGKTTIMEFISNLEKSVGTGFLVYISDEYASDVNAEEKKVTVIIEGKGITYDPITNCYKMLMAEDKAYYQKKIYSAKIDPSNHRLSEFSEINEEPAFRVLYYLQKLNRKWILKEEQSIGTDEISYVSNKGVLQFASKLFVKCNGRIMKGKAEKLALRMSVPEIALERHPYYEEFKDILQYDTKAADSDSEMLYRIFAVLLLNYVEAEIERGQGIFRVYRKISEYAKDVEKKSKDKEKGYRLCQILTNVINKSMPEEYDWGREDQNINTLDPMNIFMSQEFQANVNKNAPDISEETTEVRDLIPFYKALETLLQNQPQAFFINDAQLKMELVLSKLTNKGRRQTETLVKKLDEMIEWGTIGEAIKKTIHLGYDNISYGEMTLLNILAAVHTRITETQKEEGENAVNYILLLDEPDDGFHPEWSRCFVRYLTEMLNNAPFNHYKCAFQIIITTHSPILLSDIPKENIHCIKIDFEKNIRTLQDSEGGFMSNISELMKSSFFMESLFGENARNYTNDLIGKVKELYDEVTKAQDKYSERPREEIVQDIQNLEEKSRVINEPVIREFIGKRIRYIRELIYQQGDDNKTEKIKDLLNQIRQLENQ